MPNPSTRDERSWLFVGGADEAALIAAADSDADVLIHELGFQHRHRDRRPEKLHPAYSPPGRRVAVAAVRVNRWRAAAATISMLRSCMARRCGNAAKSVRTVASSVLKMPFWPRNDRRPPNRRHRTVPNIELARG